MPSQGQDVLDRWYPIRSRYFTRGWTLQELIAPNVLNFYSEHWVLVGKKRTCRFHLEHFLGIPARVLTHGAASFDDYSVAQRMSWAAGRQCTRGEDTAYCLLGLFGIHMPLLYGEGGPRAFRRLQEVIWGETDDHSLLAWTSGGDPARSWLAEGCFARSPADFASCADVVVLGEEAGEPSALTKKGVRITLPLESAGMPETSHLYWQNRHCATVRAVLNCGAGPDERRVSLMLVPNPSMGTARSIGPTSYSRLCTEEHVLVDDRPEYRYPSDRHLQTIYISREPAGRAKYRYSAHPSAVRDYQLPLDGSSSSSIGIGGAQHPFIYIHAHNVELRYAESTEQLVELRQEQLEVSNIKLSAQRPDVGHSVGVMLVALKPVCQGLSFNQDFGWFGMQPDLGFVGVLMAYLVMPRHPEVLIKVVCRIRPTEDDAALAMHPIPAEFPLFGVALHVPSEARWVPVGQRKGDLVKEELVWAGTKVTARLHLEYGGPHGGVDTGLREHFLLIFSFQEEAAATTGDGKELSAKDLAIRSVKSV